MILFCLPKQQNDGVFRTIFLYCEGVSLNMVHFYSIYAVYNWENLLTIGLGLL